MTACLGVMSKRDRDIYQAAVDASQKGKTADVRETAGSLVRLYDRIQRLRRRVARQAKDIETWERFANEQADRLREVERIAASELRCAKAAVEVEALERAAVAICRDCAGADPRVSLNPTMDGDVLAHHFMDSGDWVGACEAAKVRQMIRLYSGVEVSCG